MRTGGRDICRINLTWLSVHNIQIAAGNIWLVRGRQHNNADFRRLPTLFNHIARTTKAKFLTRIEDAARSAQRHGGRRCQMASGLGTVGEE